MQDALKRLFDETAAWMSEANAVEEPSPASADASALQEELSALKEEYARIPPSARLALQEELSALKEEYVRMAPCTEE